MAVICAVLSGRLKAGSMVAVVDGGMVFALAGWSDWPAGQSNLSPRFSERKCYFRSVSIFFTLSTMRAQWPRRSSCEAPLTHIHRSHYGAGNRAAALGRSAMLSPSHTGNPLAPFGSLSVAPRHFGGQYPGPGGSVPPIPSSGVAPACFSASVQITV